MSTLRYLQPILTLAQTFSGAGIRQDPGNALRYLYEDASSQLRATTTLSVNAHGRVTGALTEDASGVDLWQVTGLSLKPSDLAFLANPTNDFFTLYPALIGLLSDDTRVFGTSSDDWMESGSGNDTVAAMDGNDRIYEWAAGDKVINGGAGQDSLYFQQLVDSAVLNPFVEQLVVNLTTGHGRNPYGGALTLTGVEAVIGTSQADRIVGDSQANMIGDGIFDTGADVIDARGGDDLVLVGTLSLARADGGTGIDTLEFRGSIDLTDPSIIAHYRNFEIYKEALFFAFPPGSVLSGDGGDNWFIGATGADTLQGRGGDDLLDGGLAFNPNTTIGADVALFSGASGKYQVTLQGATLTVTDLRAGIHDGSDTVVNVEILRFANGDISVASIDANIGEAQFGTSGDDGFLRGTALDDSLYGLAGNDTLAGGGGSNLLVGDVGDDTYLADAADSDIIVEKAGEGIDTILLAFLSGLTSYSLAGISNVENLAVADNHAWTLTGNPLDNLITGFSFADTLSGASGNDTLVGGAGGADQLFGGGGDDRLVGGIGADQLAGGTGSDVFVYLAFSDSTVATPDLILDFNHNAGDRIDLSALDAIAGGSDDMFQFIGKAAFSALGQARVFAQGGNTFVTLNATGDLAADMVIEIVGTPHIGAADLIL